MKTSREIYHQLKWDSFFDKTLAKIGYNNRESSPKEVPFQQFDPHGEIPWHRIVYFKYKEVVFWDRGIKLDLSQQLKRQHIVVEESVKTTDEPLARVKKRTAYVFSSNEWTQTQLEKNIISDFNKTSLTIGTFNILCDLHESDKIYTHLRFPEILKLLKQVDKDIVFLQEATPAFSQLLEEDLWIRKTYSLSSFSQSADFWRPHGELILSKYPIKRVTDIFINKGRRPALLVDIIVQNRPVLLLNVHLSSNRSAGPSGRKHELEKILKVLSNIEKNHTTDLIIGGDFNFNDETEPLTLKKNGFIDLWEFMNPINPGHTFNPETNVLTKTISFKATCRRMDRLFLRPSSNILSPESITVYHNIEFSEQKFLSDHYPLFSQLNINMHPEKIKLDCAQSIDNKIVIHLGKSIEIFILKYLPIKPSERLHLPLCYGPEPEEQGLEEEISRLKQFFRNFPNFTLYINKACLVYLENTIAIGLEVSSYPDKLLEILKSSLTALYPVENFPRRDQMSSHVTYIPLIYFSQQNEKKALRLLKDIQKNWQTVEITRPDLSMMLVDNGSFNPSIGELCILNNTFSPVDSLSETIKNHPLWESDNQKLIRRNLISKFKDIELELIGSSLLEITHQQSDIDFLAIDPIRKHRLIESLQKVLPENYRCVDNSAVPHIKFSIENFEVDIQYSNSGLQDTFNTNSKINQQLSSHSDLKLMLATWRLWTISRCVNHQALGYPPSLLWAYLLLVAHKECDFKESNFERNFKLWVQWLNSALNSSIDPIALIAKEKNIRITLTKGSMRILKHEIRRANRLSDLKNWPLFFKNRSPRYSPFTYAFIANGADAHGLLLGEMLSLINRVEKMGYTLIAYSTANIKQSHMTPFDLFAPREIHPEIFNALRSKNFSIVPYH